MLRSSRQFRLQWAPHDGTRAHGCSCASLQTDVPPEEEMCRKNVTGACESMQATPAVALYPWQCRLPAESSPRRAADALCWQGARRSRLHRSQKEQSSFRNGFHCTQ